MRKGRELGYSSIWISGGNFFSLKCQFMDGGCFIGHYEFSISEKMEMKDRQ